MALSSKAANGLQNGYKYNGIAEESSFDLDLYDAYYRTLDPQLGRWWQVDPMATSFPGISGYSSAFNNPVNLSDPLGDCPTCPGDGKEGDIWNYMGQLFRKIGGHWIGSGPETVVTASLLGNFLRHDVLNTRFVSSGFWQLTNRPNNELPYLQGQVPFSNPGWHTAPPETVSPYHPDLIDKWSESNNGLARGTYNMIDNVYVFLGSLNPFKNHVLHLNGELANKKERVNAFVGATSDVVTTIIGEKVATEAGALIFGRFATKGGTNTIYRVVSKEEAADVLVNGFRQAPISSGVSSYEGKLFWTNIKDARWYYNWIGESNKILKIRVNNSFIFENGFDAGRQFYYVSPERLPLFNSAIRYIK